MIERRFRVAWKNTATGVGGHGSYMPMAEAKATFARAQGAVPANVVYRLEIEPAPAPEVTFPQPAGQFSTDNWQSDANQIAEEKGGDGDEDEE